MKIYGPYGRKDCRKHVILYENGHRTTMSYPKFLYWQETGIRLPIGMDIHHRDENIFNDCMSNFQLVVKGEHNKIHTKEETFECGWCDKKITLKGGKLSDRKSNARKGKRGPFCSRKCSGKYGAFILYEAMCKESTGGRKSKARKKADNFIAWRNSKIGPVV